MRVYILQIKRGETAMQNDLIRFIDPDGSLVGDLGVLAQHQELAVELYCVMHRTRSFDLKAVSLQRTGQIGTYPSSLGQEAIFCCAGHAMQEADVYAPYYRDHGAFLQRGMSMAQILQYWGGDERASHFGNAHDFPISVPIATHVPHAVGAATAFKFKDIKQAVVVTCGDGATSKGDFLESLNLAGVWQLPVVFLINNNGWAISVPMHLQTRLSKLTDKALGAGFEGVRVDGNDALALHHCLTKALNKARSGGGPTLVEAVTDRLCDHTTADDATRYRQPEELKRAWEAEPLKRLQTYLVNEGLWDEGKEKQLKQEIEAEVLQAVEEYKAVAPQQSEDLFDSLYADLPREHQLQRDELVARQFLKRHELMGWGENDV